MFDDFDKIDLTHVIDNHTPSWSGSCAFCYDIKRDYDSGIRVLKYSMHASCGTHVDAPSHFFRNGKNIADLEIAHLIAPCIKIDLSHRLSPSLQLTKQDVLDFEEQYGIIEKGSFVIFASGWQQYWNTHALYRNQQEDGDLLFPTIHSKAAEYLMTKEIVGIGVDTLSPDSIKEDFPVHRLFLGEGKYIVENLTQLEKLPPIGATIFIMPLKIKEGSEAPARCLALVKKTKKKVKNDN